MSKRLCETSVIKPRKGRGTRRTQAEIDVVGNAVISQLRRHNPMTCRQLFYRLVSKGEIPKTELAYKSLCRLLGKMRRDGRLPFRWIADHTRYMRRPRTYSGLRNMLEFTQATYRRAVWDDQEAYVEIWSEKETLAGVLYETTASWDVPLMLCRGYPSISFLHSAAEAMDAEDKPIFVYYFGDHDPSGRDIDRFIEEQLLELAPGIDLHFARVAVTEEQIESMGLQTRPTKTTDSRSKKFSGRSVEVDAIDPDELREICSDCILRHVDQDAHRSLLNIEAQERETLEGIILRLEDGAA